MSGPCAYTVRSTLSLALLYTVAWGAVHKSRVLVVKRLLMLSRVRCAAARPTCGVFVETTVTLDPRLPVRYYALPFSESLEDGVVYVPLSPTEPVLDFLWVARGDEDRVLVCGQVTIAKRYGTKNAATAFGAVVQASVAACRTVVRAGVARSRRAQLLVDGRGGCWAVAIAGRRAVRVGPHVERASVAVVTGVGAWCRR